MPYPLNRGDRIRSYHILKYLAEVADVSLATLADEPVEDETRCVLDKLTKRVAIESLGTSRWINGALSLAAGHSATEGLFRSPRLKRIVQQWSRTTRWDAIIVYCSSMMQYAEMEETAGIPVIVDLVDVDSQKFFDYAALSRGFRRWLYHLEGARLRRLESSLPKKVHAITLVSEVESRLYQSFCPNQITHEVQNGVDLAHFTPAATGTNCWAPLSAAESSNLVFVGALDYRANIDGAKWFVDRIWSPVKTSLPQLTFSLVGRNPGPEIERLADVPGVRVVGNVPDVRPYLAAADVVVAPLRVARGVQNKVLEAMAMAKPVVCSPAAAEGLRFSFETGLKVAHTDSDWVTAITQLIQSSELLVRHGQCARSLVERDYEWSRALRTLGALVGNASNSVQHNCMATAC